MKKSYDFSKLDLNHFTETVWHIRAVYEEMVNHGRISKFSAESEDQYERGQYRSIYSENQAITDMAYEFTMGFDDENPNRDQFIDRYGCDYDDAIIKFAEERLPKIFNDETENIKQTDKSSYARKIAYFSVIADRAYKRLQEDHKLDDNRKSVVTFLQYTDFIGNMAHDFSNISELCFKNYNDIHFEAEDFATKEILDKYGNTEWLAKEMIHTIVNHNGNPVEMSLLKTYLTSLDFFEDTVKPFVDRMEDDNQTAVTTGVWNSTYDSMTGLQNGIKSVIERILDNPKIDNYSSEDTKYAPVMNWIYQHARYFLEVLENK